LRFLVYRFLGILQRNVELILFRHYAAKKSVKVCLEIYKMKPDHRGIVQYFYKMKPYSSTWHCCKENTFQWFCGGTLNVSSSCWNISRNVRCFIEFTQVFYDAFHSIQLCAFHDGCKQGIDQQIFNRKSISRKITHPQS